MISRDNLALLTIIFLIALLLACVSDGNGKSSCYKLLIICNSVVVGRQCVEDHRIVSTGEVLFEKKVEFTYCNGDKDYWLMSEGCEVSTGAACGPPND